LVIRLRAQGATSRHTIYGPNRLAKETEISSRGPDGMPPAERDGPPFGDAADIVAIEAGRQIRAPAAAGIAGLLFAIMYTAALVLLRNDILYTADDAELVRLFARGEDFPAVIGGLYLAPFAGVMFLWFVAVIRDQIGDREDRFFATVFFGSGILFVGLLFVASAIASAPSVGVRYLDQPPPSAAMIDAMRSMAYTITFAFENRAAGVFLIATATIGLKTGVFPRWFSGLSYLVGAVLLIAVTFLDVAILALPVWVAFVSLFILLRERRQRAD
jgi:hypothetical protein